MVAVAPGAMVPKAHGYAVTQLPVFETNVRPAGVVSATDTPVAVLGPLFVTVTVYEIVEPGVMIADPVFTFAIERSVEAVTVAVQVDELLAGVGSLVVELTVAVLLIEPVTVEL